ncbi:MAG TPA: alpha/beta fold hydrolase [Ornithinicoccus sp.]|nr:alpha/beta fold hydrolase [Ornithinicoccus sp.]
MLLPTWTIVPSRIWRFQVAALARHLQVVTFEGRGSAEGDSPAGATAYRGSEVAADTVAVMDDAGVDRAVLVGFSLGAPWAVRVAAEHPDRVDGLVLIAGSGTGARQAGHRTPEGEREAREMEAAFNATAWVEGGWEDFVQFFFSKLFSEPHSTKPIEDAVRWARRVDPAVMVDTLRGAALDGPEVLERESRRLTQPVLVLHGTEDKIQPASGGELLADWTGGALTLLQGSGHAPHVRDPVRVSRMIEDFTMSSTPLAAQQVTARQLDRASPADVAGPVTGHSARRTWTRAHSRPRRALYLSSPIGLGHARRDVAVAQELRNHHPDLQIDWFAQAPVTRVLEEAGERVHPASRWLASETAHIEDEAAEHDLHAFQAIRRMDEILVHNFMLFADVVEEGCYDLVVGDEAWDVDYFLHENPELKRFSFAWMTDFVGWLPMPDGGEHEVALTADYNTEMIEQRARYRRIRDASVFVGNPQDVVDLPFGPGLPRIREWTEANFDFAGYVTGFVPPTEEQREAARVGLGYRDDHRVCVVTVGGSGVGESLLRRVLDAVPAARRLVPNLHFLVVTGPRIDPGSLPRRRGVTYRGYLPDLYQLLAACDLAVVQGGLTTCMELAAADRPFLYVPLRHHFEQNLHVRHRLERYGAGTCIDYELATNPDALASAIAAEMARGSRSAPVETDGAQRAAALLAELL